MKNLSVSGGDLVLGSSRRAKVVTGREKLVQDLTLWLLEPLGQGYLTPSFGSTLNTMVRRDDRGRSQGAFIGRSLDDEMLAEVEAEVDRIINLYQQDQIQKVRRAQLEGRLYLFSRKEILNTIDDIKAKRNADRAVVQVKITTGANASITFLAEVDDNAVNIASGSE